MEFKTNGTAKTVHGLNVVDLFVVATKTTDMNERRYYMYVDFYSDENKKFESFNILKMDGEGNKIYFEKNIYVDFEEVVGIEGEIVEDTIDRVMLSKLEDKLLEFELLVDKD